MLADVGSYTGESVLFENGRLLLIIKLGGHCELREEGLLRVVTGGVQVLERRRACLISRRSVLSTPHAAPVTIGRRIRLIREDRHPEAAPNSTPQKVLVESARYGNTELGKR